LSSNVDEWYAEKARQSGRDTDAENQNQVINGYRHIKMLKSNFKKKTFPQS